MKLFSMILMASLAVFSPAAQADSDMRKLLMAAVGGEQNLGPQISGGLHEVKDVEFLRRESSRLKTGCEDAKPGNEFGYGFSVVEQQWKKKPYTEVETILLLVHACEPYFLEPSAIAFRPRNSAKWYVMFDTMKSISYVETFGQWGTGDDLLFFAGVSYWSGGGRSLVTERIDLNDTKQTGGVTAVSRNAKTEN